MAQLWHRDRRHFKVNEDDEVEYLMASIDDQSRRIMSHHVLPHLTMITTSEVLERALVQPGMLDPQTMTMDNGGEFAWNEFQVLL